VSGQPPGRCAHCQGPVAPGAGREVTPEHGTSASAAQTVHADRADCGPIVPVRTHA
jgi:hypothetical protein